MSNEHELNAIVNGVMDKVGLVEDIQGAIARIRARATDDDDIVTAEVDGMGTLTGLWIDDSIANSDARTVSALIIATANQASLNATTQRAALLSQLQEGLEKP
ncbi:MAG: YbaB/EbfC family nucleoid-associated protein [Rhodococcus sp.]|nr:YbaB/EbfC family nucleoid-associated protein [Rhodococcus sp. (in: high G+C Gram-positive bacteria)]